MTTANDICAAMRNCGSLSHGDLETVLACFACTLQRSDLSDRCKVVAVDLADEIVGQVEDDRIQQQQETAWYHREDVPACAGTWAQLDALTIRAAA